MSLLPDAANKQNKDRQSEMSPDAECGWEWNYGSTGALLSVRQERGGGRRTTTSLTSNGNLMTPTQLNERVRFGCAGARDVADDHVKTL